MTETFHFDPCPRKKLDQKKTKIGPKTGKNWTNKQAKADKNWIKNKQKLDQKQPKIGPKPDKNQT